MRTLGAYGAALLGIGIISAVIGLLSPCTTSALNSNPNASPFTCAGTLALAEFGFLLGIAGLVLLVAGWSPAESEDPG